MASQKVQTNFITEQTFPVAQSSITNKEQGFFNNKGVLPHSFQSRYFFSYKLKI